jgi:hypothetical protein
MSVVLNLTKKGTLSSMQEVINASTKRISTISQVRLDLFAIMKKKRDGLNSFQILKKGILAI